MASIMDWKPKVDAIGPDGLSATRTASEAERRQIAADLGVLGLEALTATIRIKAGSGGRYRLTGHIDATVTQSCVVTLEPVASTISEDIDAAFWPIEQIGPMAEGEHSVLEADSPEPIENGRIAVDRLVYELLAASLDPYPRKPDVSFEGAAHGPAGPGDKPASPFALLSRLKQQS